MPPKLPRGLGVAGDAGVEVVAAVVSALPANAVNGAIVPSGQTVPNDQSVASDRVSVLPQNAAQSIAKDQGTNKGFLRKSCRWRRLIRLS
jgi:hypothetical protein